MKETNDVSYEFKFDHVLILAWSSAISPDISKARGCQVVPNLPAFLLHGLEHLGALYLLNVYILPEFAAIPLLLQLRIFSAGRWFTPATRIGDTVQQKVRGGGQCGAICSLLQCYSMV